MVEITEYTIVVFVSALFALASVSVYASFSQFESSAQTDSSFSSIVALAVGAVTNGSARESLLLPDSTLSCMGGTLDLKTSTADLRADVGEACDFSLPIDQGSRSVSFSSNGSTLTAEVT